MSQAPSGLGGFFQSDAFEDLLGFLLPLLGVAAGGAGGFFAGQAGQNFLNAGRIRTADEEALARTTGAAGGLPNINFDELSSATGLDQPVSQGVGEFSPLFTSADTFREGFNFQPLDVNEFRFDPSDLRELGGRLGEDLRGGAVDFDTLLSQSNVEGLTDRAAARFPDFNEFRGNRLAGIADAAREAQTQARQQISGSFGSLEEGQSELARRQFAGQLSAGRASSQVESDVEGLLGRQAEFLGGLELDEVQIRDALSRFAAQDAQTRDIAGADVEGRLFGQGEALSAQNLGLLADIERFNQTTPIDIASRQAQFTSFDQAQSFNAFAGQLAGRIAAFLQSQGQQVSAESIRAQILSQFEGTTPLLSSGGLENFAVQRELQNQQGGGNSFGLSF